MKSNILHTLTYPCNFCDKGLQCVLSTVGIPASILLQAVRTVSETAQKQSEYIVYGTFYQTFLTFYRSVIY